MKKIIVGIVAVVVLAGGGWVVYNVVSAPEEVAQTGGPGASGSTLRGTFEGSDSLHDGSGEAVLENGKLTFLDFSVTNGPDLYVYLSKTADGSTDGAVSLGRLQSDSGEQSYTLPQGYEQYASVLIYCRAFKVPFAVAAVQ